MHSCQAAVFKTIAESPLPLSKQNILQTVDYSQAAVSRSVTNLREKEFISSFQTRYFLTDKGREYYSSDPTLHRLDKTVGSYSTMYSKPNPKKQDFIQTIIKECTKTSLGQEFLRSINEIKTSNSWAPLLAPWVAFFAIQAGLITEPVLLNGPTDAELDAVNKEITKVITSYYN